MNKTPDERDYPTCYSKLAQAALLAEKAANLLADATFDAPPSLEAGIEEQYQNLVMAMNDIRALVRK